MKKVLTILGATLLAISMFGFAAQAATIIFLLFEGALVDSQNFHETWPIESARERVAALLAA